MLRRKGTTLIEALVTTAIVGIAAIVLSGALLNIRLNRTTRLEAAAGFLAQAGIEGVRALPFSKLADQTDGPFRNVLFQNGSWNITATAGAPSGPNVVNLAASSGTGLTSLAIVPVGSGVRDGTVTASLKVPAGSPAGWQVGFLFRAEDRDHAYVAWLSSTQVKVQKIVGASAADLFSQNAPYAVDTWYKLSVTFTGTSMDIRVNDVLLNPTPFVDSTYTGGSVALVAYSGTSVSADDVEVIQSGTETWDFDTAETPGQAPVGWERFGIANLPSGQAFLTVADAQVGEMGLKRVTTKVQWTIDGKTFQRTAETLVGKGGVGQ